MSAKSNSRLPLTSRPLDLIYFIYFATHIPPTLLLDLQGLYPTVPAVLRNLLEGYVTMTSDPLVGSVNGIINAQWSSHLVWFKSFMVLEVLFQLPVFFLGMYGLYYGSRTIYVLLLAYGASTATTTLPCVMYLLFPPSRIVKPDAAQQMMLLGSYLPYLIIPLVMAVDMGMRVVGIINAKTKTQ